MTNEYLRGRAQEKGLKLLNSEIKLKKANIVHSTEHACFIPGRNVFPWAQSNKNPDTPGTMLCHY